MLENQIEGHPYPLTHDSIARDFLWNSHSGNSSLTHSGKKKPSPLPLKTKRPGPQLRHFSVILLGEIENPLGRSDGDGDFVAAEF